MAEAKFKLKFQCSEMKFWCWIFYRVYFDTSLFETSQYLKFFQNLHLCALYSKAFNSKSSTCVQVVKFSLTMIQKKEEHWFMGQLASGVATIGHWNTVYPSWSLFRNCFFSATTWKNECRDAELLKFLCINK